jgi:hypothetical protein
MPLSCKSTKRCTHITPTPTQTRAHTRVHMSEQVRDVSKGVHEEGSLLSDFFSVDFFFIPSR